MDIKALTESAIYYKNRRSLRVGLAFAILAFGILYFLRRQFPRVHGTEKNGIADHTVQANLQSLTRAKRGLPTTRRLDANDIDAAKARKLIANARWAIVNAKSYRMVSAGSGTSGDGQTTFLTSFTLIHEKSQKRGDLFRCDTIIFSAPTSTFSPETMKPMPRSSRIQITNEDGNWEMGDQPGRDGIAFLLKDNQDPIETVAMNRSFALDAQGVESVDDQSSFTAANGNVDGTPVVNITRTEPPPHGPTTIYTIDAVSGNLLSTLWPGPNGGVRQNFDLSPTIDESDFEIPRSLVKVEVSDKMAAQNYLSVHK